MSARPLFLGGARRVDFAETTGHTEPAVAVTGVRVLGEDGARLDLHRVTPARDWLSDDELGRLAANDDVEAIEEKRRAETRERLRQVQDEWKLSRREWLLYAIACVIGVSAFVWAPNPGYGWSVGKALEELTP